MKKQNNPSLKARLLPGAIYMLLTVCAIPFALAQPCSVTSSCSGLVFNQPTEFIINLSESVDPATVQPTDFTVNGIPANNDSISPDNLTITFIFNTSPVVLGRNTMHISAGVLTASEGQYSNSPASSAIGPGQRQGHLRCHAEIAQLRPRPRKAKRGGNLISDRLRFRSRQNCF